MTFPEHLEVLKGFEDCTKLTTVTLPDGLKTLNAFNNCTGLRSDITIPASVEELDGFSGCTGLTRLIFLDTDSSSSSWKGGHMLDNLAYEKSSVIIRAYQASGILSMAKKKGLAFETMAEDGKIVSGKVGDDITWEFDKNGTVTLSGTGGIWDYGEAFGMTPPWEEAGIKDEIRAVVVEEGITTLDTGLFYGCPNLTDVTIPDSVTELNRGFVGETPFVSDIKGVKYLNGWALDCGDDVTALVIEEGTKGIADNAFWERKITSVNIPESVTYIGSGAFYSCDKLGRVTLPEKLTYLGAGAFSDCKNLSNLDAPEDIEYVGGGTFSGTPLQTNQKILYIGGWAANSAPTIETAQIKSGTKAICDNTFNGREELTSVEIPDSVTYIGIEAFAYSGITSIVIPDTVTECGGSLFNCCRNLKTAVLSDNITELKVTELQHSDDTCFFGNCHALEEVHLPKHLKVLEGLYCCTILKTLEIPEEVERIANVRQCTALTEITIPANVKFISENAFAECSALKKITVLNPALVFDGTIIYTSEYDSEKGQWIENYDGTFYGYQDSTAQAYAEQYGCGFQTIGSEIIDSGTGSDNLKWTLDRDGTLTISGTGEMVFKEGESRPISPYVTNDTVKRIIIEEGVTSIANDAFRYFSELSTVQLPSTLKTIGGSAFDFCRKLSAVDIPASVTAIGRSAFSDCSSLTDITIPASVQSIGTSAFQGCNKLESFRVDSANENYLSEDGVLFDKNKTVLIAYPASKKATAYTIPDSVLSIAEYAFYNSRNLVSVDIPNGLTHIQRGAFEECTGLESMTLPLSVSYIDYQGFAYCSGLKELTILNDACYIYDDPWTIVNDEHSEYGLIRTLTIRGYEGSTAQEYAEKYSCKFEIAADAERGYSKVTEGVLTFKVYPEYAELINCDSAASGEITIPDKVNGVPTTILGDYCFSSAGEVTAVNIPETVTTIGMWAFQDVGFETITIPSSVKCINEAAFFCCSRLETVIILNRDCEIREDYLCTICNTCTSWDFVSRYYGVIRGYACSTSQEYAKKHNYEFEVIGENESHITVKDGLRYRVNSDHAVILKCDADVTGDLVLPGEIEGVPVTRISGSAFEGCAHITSVIIPDHVTEIGYSAFSDCSDLKEVKLPDSLKVIGDNCFSYCDQLISIEIPASVTKIGENAFYICHSLESVTILNPGCEIPGWSIINFGDSYEDGYNGVIRGYADSTAEDYAKDFESRFESLGAAPAAPAAGDFNGDGDVTAADAVLLARFAVEDPELTEGCIGRISAAKPDQNGDGLVTILDVTAILRKLGTE